MVTIKDVKLCSMIALTFIYFMAQIVLSHVTHSLTLLTESYHMLYNILSLLGCFISVKMSREQTLRNTFGWARIEVLGMMVSILFMAALCFSVLVEAAQTMFHASHQDAMHHPLVVGALGIAGVVLNLLCFFLLGDQKRPTKIYEPLEKINMIDGRKRLRGAAYRKKAAEKLQKEEKVVSNTTLYSFFKTKEEPHASSSSQKQEGYTHEQGCFLYVQGEDVEVNVVIGEDISIKKRKLSIKQEKQIQESNKGEANSKSLRGQLAFEFFRDVCGSLIVISCSCIVYFTDGDIALFADPALSIISVIIFLSMSSPFIKQSGMILLQTIPDNIDVTSLKARLTKQFPSIINVHEMHVWRLTRNKIIATAHIILMSPRDYSCIAEQVTEFFKKEGIILATIQPEFIKYDNHKPVQSTDCILRCTKMQCQARSCCDTTATEETDTEPLHCQPISHPTEVCVGSSECISSNQNYLVHPCTIHKAMSGKQATQQPAESQNQVWDEQEKSETESITEQTVL